MRRKRRWPLGALAMTAAVPLVLFFFLTALGRLEQDSAGAGRHQLEEALRRAAVACYAAEGAYPADLDALEDRYGIQIDRDHYTVFYNVFGSNLLPDITVLDNET